MRMWEIITTGQAAAPFDQAAAQAVASSRAAAGISQTQLAARTGIDQSDLSKIERGLANPSVAMLLRIANALGGKLAIAIEMPPARETESGEDMTSTEPPHPSAQERQTASQ